HLVGQARPPADGREADVLLHDLGPLVAEVLAEQRHQEVELRLWPLQFFDAEAVERELADAEPAALLDGRANALDAAAVALDARQAALPGPAAVAVHDNGDVPRQPLRGEAGRGEALQGVRGEARGCGQEEPPSLTRITSSRPLWSF